MQHRVTTHRPIGTPAPSHITFRRAVREVLDDYRINRRRSLPDVERHVRLHLEPFFARRPMVAITTADVRRYITRRQDAGVTNATINRDGVEGSWVEKDLAFDASLLHPGQNTLTLTVPAGSLTSGISYDVVRLELAATP